MGIFEFLIIAGNIPFTAALGLMFTLFGLELASIMIGLGLSNFVDDLFDFDHDMDVDVDVSPASSHIEFLTWLQFGRVPFLILFSAFLGAFGLIGLSIQWIALSILGIVVTSYIIGPIAFISALPITRVIGKIFAHIIPKEHTEVIRLEDLTGNRAMITLGVARMGHSAEAKIKDQFGTTHYLRVEPLNEDEEFTSGMEVVLVKKEGNIFRISNIN